ncbi:helix-turn-helix domain-containing protein [Brevibacillus thermoruber]|uniref:helix-turn-helix domain-containing protein n=1 Tax=Brevibacillus thermoruber TaxID=33942 RepID=UPI000411A963|nr:helix-turn-helix transcriptional regulator [Brevibacillus thermoruber]
MIRFKLLGFIEEHGITRGALAREAKVRPNAVYEMCDNKTKRIDLDTFDKILETLNEMTGREVTLQDILEYIPNKK